MRNTYIKEEEIQLKILGFSFKNDLCLNIQNYVQAFQITSFGTGAVS